MGEPNSALNSAADPPKRKRARLLLLVVLFLLLAVLSGYLRLRLETSDRAMEDAVTSGNLAKVRWLCRIRPSLVKAIEAHGPPPGYHGFWHVRGRRVRPTLFFAEDADNPEMIELLISKGADINEPNELGQSPLEAAAVCGRTKAVEALLRLGAPIYPRALFDAAASSDPASVELFLNRGADPNAKDNMGLTPLFCAAFNRRPEAASLLLAHGADPNAKDILGRTPLFYAAEGCGVAAVRLLLDHGADPNVRDGKGYTALSTTAGHLPYDRKNRKIVIALLLDNGSDPNADPRTLSIAESQSHFEGVKAIVEMLIESGAK